MNLETIDTVFNFLILVFWFRIWSVGDSRLFFNPYLAPVNRFSESVLTFLWPVFRRTPVRLVASILVLLLLALRGLAVPQSVRWTLVVGFEHATCPPTTAWHIAFSAISFGIFLFKVWGFSLVYAGARRGSFYHASDTLYRVSVPLSDVRFEFRPLVLSAFGLLLAWGLNAITAAISGESVLLMFHSPFVLLKYFISALACWATVVPVLVTILIVLILCSWVSLFAPEHPINHVCREWLDTFMGPLRNHPIRIGMIDLTALVLIIALQFLYPLLLKVMASSYDRLS